LGSAHPDQLRAHSVTQALYLDLGRGQVLKGVKRETRKGEREGKAKEV